MNLIIIAALVVAAVADKLDRTYLPPASAKTAGGSPGTLKTPFASNSLNNGLGGLPKGGYTNEFQGVVVNAVAPGTRAAGPEDTGLGAPRISYGSTNSKVGAAAFKTNPTAWSYASEAEGQATGAVEQAFSNQVPGRRTAESPRAALDRAANTIKFDTEVGSESYSYSFETDNGITAQENGVATNGVQAQGGFSYTGDDGQVYTVTYTADEGGYQPRGDHLPTPPPIPEEILKSLEQNARDEAAGLVDDGSYDPQKYNTGGDYADSDDTNGKYSHQSSKFGSAGETDVTASGSFISQNNQPGRPGQSSQSAHVFGSENEVEHSPGHHAHNQGNSGVNRQFGSSKSKPAGQNENEGHTDSDGHGEQSQGNNEFNGHLESSSFVHGTSASGSSQNPKYESEIFDRNSGHNGAHAFAQSDPGVSRPSANSGFPLHGQTGLNSNRFGQTSQFTSNTNQGVRYGNTNEYISPMNSFKQNIPQNKRPGFKGASKPDLDNNAQTEAVQSFPTQTYEDKPQGSNSVPSYIGKPSANGFLGQFGFQQLNQGITQNQPSNNIRPTSISDQLEQTKVFGNRFSSKNEYLPPSNQFGTNQISNHNQPQPSTQFNQQYNDSSQLSANMPSPQNQQQRPLSDSAFFNQQQSSFGSMPQARPQNNRRPSYQNNSSFLSSQFSASSPGIQSQPQEAQLGQIKNEFSPQKATSQPDIELTTPLESSIFQNMPDLSSTGSFNARLSQSTLRASTSASTASLPHLGSQPNARPQETGSRPFESKPSQPATYPRKPSPNQYQSQTNSQFGAPSSFSHENDVKGAPSTPSPTYAQQSQSHDDSNYYRQPSKPFGSSGSRLTTVPYNKFNRVPQHTQNNQFLAQAQPHFPTQNSQFQGSTFPMPPSIAPTVSSQSQSSSLPAQYNGITQASISPFSAQAPTQSTQFTQQGQFGRLTNQPMKPLSRTPSRSSFGQSSIYKASFSQTTTTPFVQKPGQSTYQPQQSLNQNQPEPSESASGETPSQQYNGELYEYNKPPAVVPAPEKNEPAGSDTFGQSEQIKFGAQPSRDQLGQNNDASQSSTSQFGQAVQNSRPFGALSKPQYGQKIQQSGFGSQIVAQDSSEHQFGTQTLASVPNQNLNTNDQDSPVESQPFGSEVQKPSSACCQGSHQGSLPISLRPLQGLESQAQIQFGQSSFTGPKSYRAEASVSSFAGKGEQFGGPRKPPSFDEKTGYHY